MSLIIRPHVTIEWAGNRVEIVGYTRAATVRLGMLAVWIANSSNYFIGKKVKVDKKQGLQTLQAPDPAD